MALPTKTDLQKMDYAFQGQPFVDVPSKDSINLATMDYAFKGKPFVNVLTAEGEEEETEANAIFFGTNL